MEHVPLSDSTAVEVMDGVSLSLLAGTESINVQHYRTDPGVIIEEHSHANDQVGFVVEGELTLIVDGEETVCGPGDSYAVPGGQAHAAENRGDVTVTGIDVFSPPRTRSEVVGLSERSDSD